MKELEKWLISSAFFFGGIANTLAEQNTTKEVSSDVISQTKNDVVIAKTMVASAGNNTINFSKEQQSSCLKDYGKIIFFTSGAYNLGLNSEEIECVVLGFKEGANEGKFPVKIDPEGIKTMQEFILQKEREQIENTKKIGKIFLENKGREAGFQTTPSGLVYKTNSKNNLEANNDSNALVPVKDSNALITINTDSTVKINYEVKTIEGKIIDSSYERGGEAIIYVGDVIPAFREAIQLATNAGGKIEAFCSSDLGFGDNQFGSIPGGSALWFTIDVIEIVDAKDVLNAFNNALVHAGDAPPKDTSIASDLLTDKQQKLLKLGPKATKDEIEEAYKKETLKYLPDKFENNKGMEGYECKTIEEATARFQEIKNEYEKLTKTK